MDSSRVKLLIAGGLAVLVLAPVRVLGLGETVELRHKVAQGETLTYTYALATTSWFRAFTAYRSIQRDVTGQHIIRVKDLSPDGAISLELVRSLRVTEQGRSEDAVLPVVEIRMRPDGEILKLAGGSATYLLLRFPDHPVANDESWTHGQFFGFAGFAGLVAVPRTLTLVGVEQLGEQRVARIQIRGESSVTRDLPAPPAQEEFKLRVSGTIRLTGEILWLIDQGRMQRFGEEANLDAPLYVQYGGVSETGRIVFKSVEQLESVPPKN